MNNKHDSATQIAREVLHSEENLPILPEMGMQLLDLAQQPLEEIDLGKLSKLIEADPTLVSKILRIANSAYYGAIDRVTSLRQAIIHVGLEETVNTITWLFHRKAMPKFPDIEGFTDRDYWAHSWACATANRMLGHPRLQTNAIPGELYIAGLLHGIGKLFLALHRADDFLTSMRKSQKAKMPLFIAELEVLGTTDGHVAYEVLKEWGLSENILYAVKHYHKPEDAHPDYREIASLTQFAYFIANGSGVGNVGDFFCVDLESTLITESGGTPLSQVKTREIYVKQIYDTLKNKSHFLTDAKYSQDNSNKINQEEQKEKEMASETHNTPDKKGVFARLMSWFNWISKKASV
jgi:HD-like signal output (HDOD) protein